MLRRLAVADVCARLPQGMVSITLLLVAAAHAAMTTAGLVVAVYTLGQGVTGPLRGRLADRYGLGRVCAVCGGLYALALVCLLAGSLARGPAGALLAAAAVAGLVVPPLSPGMRSLWSAHAAGSLRHAAFALDAAVFDLAYIAGPVLAGLLAADISPAVAVGVLLALTGAGVVIIGAFSPPRRRRPARPAHAGRAILGSLNSPALRRLLVTGALVNVALSATEVALTAYVRQHHALWASGPLLAEVSAGSIAGSLLLGTRTSAIGAGRRLPRLLARYALGLAALAAAGLYAPLVAVAAPLAGLCLGPSLATLFGLASGAAEDGEGTEAQAWLNSMMNGGAAAGAALAGITASRPVLSLAVASAVAAAAALSSAVSTGGWRRLAVAETVEEAAEEAALTGESRTGRRRDGTQAGDRLVIVGAGDGVGDLGFVETLRALDLGHVADEHAVAHDLSLKARGAVGVPLGLAPAGQRYANPELTGSAVEMSVDAAVAEDVDYPAGPEFVHTGTVSPAPERSLNACCCYPQTARALARPDRMTFSPKAMPGGLSSCSSPVSRTSLR
jgi:MFS family permease